MLIPEHIKLVAIAKDEAAFIAEWVFHHLYFGFDSIDVYVNRTTDNTVDILRRIHERYPHVCVHSADWIDLVHHIYVSNELQKIVYAYAYCEACHSKPADYLLFLDIDEFWTPLDYRSTIHDCLRTLGHPDLCSFEWFNLLPRQQEDDGLLMCGELSGETAVLVKTLVKSGLKMQVMRIHYPSCEGARSCLADGSKYIPGKHYIEHLPQPAAELKKYFITHNLIKSPLCYLASLIRNNPDFLYNNRVSFIKTNRPYAFTARHDTPLTLEPPESFRQSYAEGYARFFAECGLESPAREARVHLFTQALNAIRHIENNAGDEIIRKAVAGLDIKALRREANTRLFALR
ncbi:MAG: glycosyltransferase family 2 protein [Desulfovibrionaceae bacterium]|nr:glycosyltransferase family 2 protein [Desulfovibrionaceae bacterium]